MRFREFNSALMEGGNSRAIDISTGSPDPREYKGRPALAEKIDLTVFPRKLVTKAFIDLFKVLNNEFKKFSPNKHYNASGKNEEDKTYPLDGVMPPEGEYLWKNFKVITDGAAFNGSSDAFFNPGISDEDYIARKKKVGDIDLTIPHHTIWTLWELLRTLEGKKLTDNITYIGQNKPSPRGLNQINAVFDLTTEEGTVFAQVDFEASEYEDQDGEFKPTEWAKFSHSSHWDDMTAGIKGVFHKYLVRAMVSELSKIPNMVLLQPSSKTSSDDDIAEMKKELDAANAELVNKEYQKKQLDDEIKGTNDKKEKAELSRKKATLTDLIADLKTNIKTKTKEIEKSIPKPSRGINSDRDMFSMGAFAVTHGVRDRMARQYDAKGNELFLLDPANTERKLAAYKETKPANSKYITNIGEIFQRIFGRQPNGKERNMFGSYVGCLALLKTIPTENKQFLQAIRDRMMILMWGNDSGVGDNTTSNKPGDGQALERDDWQVDLDVKTAALKEMFRILPETKIPDEILAKVLYLYYGEDGSAYKGTTSDDITA